MPAILEDVKAAAAMLTPAERVELMDYLVQLPGECSEEEYMQWKAEIRQRFEDLRSGKVQGVPFEEVFAKRTNR